MADKATFWKYSDVAYFFIANIHEAIPVATSENAKLITKYMLGRRKHLKGSKYITINIIPLVKMPRMPITKMAMFEGFSNGLGGCTVVLLLIARTTESIWKKCFG
jgi:hypothetical protein